MTFDDDSSEGGSDGMIVELNGEEIHLSLRLGEAHRQVTQTQTPLFDIALATGFPTQASFSRAFKSAYHMSASQLRRS